MLGQWICRRCSSLRASPLHLVSTKTGLESLWQLPQIKRSNDTRSLSYRPHTWLCWSSPWKDDLHHSGSRSSIPSDSYGWRRHSITAVSTPFGLFEFVVMPFGLWNIQTFQRFMDTIFICLHLVCCYIDGIVLS
jgi:hypothetical protein